MKWDVTCVCVTHGRPYLIEEALESWRRQTYGSELLILNDCPEQTLTCKLPGVIIYNTRDMFDDLSDKFNAAVALVKTKHVAWWEDDDVSLPHRIDMSLRAVCLHGDAYKQSRAWFWEHGNIVSRPVNLFFGSVMFAKDAWRGAAKGQPADKSAWERMTNHCEAVDHYPGESDTYFIYRWGGTGHHDSGVRGSNADRFRAFRRAVLADPRFRAGEIELVPRWHHDYEAQVAAAIKAGKGAIL